MPYCLAVDIGASSGRHILGELKDGKLICTEVYRFENGIKDENGVLVWDLDVLFEHILRGFEACTMQRKFPVSVAIDTWGVDYVLLNKKRRPILPCVSYRDSRTAGVPEEVFNIISKEKLYEKTGIQKQNFNTIYQLYCDKKSGKLDEAEHFLMIPDYIAYKLTGVMKNEYTNATTTNLVNAETKTWDTEILDALGIKKNIFREPSLPKTVVGTFVDEVRCRVGFNCPVLLAPTHDTASAVAACPVDDKSVFLSSGTWSLVGTENLYPVTSKEAMEANFANEGGIDYRFRFLKNIMGMWLFQNIKRNLDNKYSYDEMMNMAMESSFTEKIDPTDESFLAPKNMIEAVRTYLGKPELPIGDVLNSVYHSLAASYDKAVKEIESVAGKMVDRIAIVGGGCKDKYLNRLTKEYTGKAVTAGPVEGTAIGNLISQLMYHDRKLTLDDARKIIINTFDIQEV